MMRQLFYFISVTSILLVTMVHFFWPPILYALIFIIPYVVIGIKDITGKKNVLINYPVIGHFRYMFEFIRPEIQQYFINTNQSGRPYNREIRNLVYQRAKGVRDTLPFGTQRDITDTGYEFALHSLNPKIFNKSDIRLTVGTSQCQQPYSASLINISGMSFGSLSSNAVLALNKGAKAGGFAQGTGEAGITQHHLDGGGDLIWQIGTAYFGCRTEDGHFDANQFQEKAQLPVVKMIELKLSQGAKPSHGGILPAVKITEEIALSRGVPMGKDCISPPAHTAFSDPVGMMQFIAKLRELSGGKPVGFKLCIGKRSEFMSICKAIVKTGILPDFITVDGAEGGTGAAPVEFSNRIGTPINEALVFVDNCLRGIGVRDQIRVIASGKIATGFDVLTKLSIGADMCNIARAMMFTIGCIQALKCDTNHCPTGVTTQEKSRVKALVVEDKYRRVARYHAATLHSFQEILGAMGYSDRSQLSPSDILIRVSQEKTISYAERYTRLNDKQLLEDKDLPEAYAQAWQLAQAEAF